MDPHLLDSRTALLTVGALLLAASSVAVVRAVGSDGYGTRVPPVSHRPDEFVPGHPRPDVRLPSGAGSARAARLLVGLALYGTAIALIVRAQLGIGPWDVLAQGVAGRTGQPFGLVTNAIGALLLLLWWPLRQRPGIGTLANVLLVGTAAQVVLGLVATPPALAARIALLVGGVLLLAIATGLYVGAGLGAGPRDGLMLGLHRRFGTPIWLARTAVEGSALLLGALLGGDVGIGTVVFAVAIGPLCGLTIPLLGPATVRGRGSVNAH